MKAIMISIKPKWVAKILNGEKTIEIRKTMPKCDLPIDVYIYCTKEEELFYSRDTQKWLVAKNRSNVERLSNGVVKAKFTLNKVEEIKLNLAMRFFTKSMFEPEIANKSCLSSAELFNYLHNNTGYAWHIDDLVIFDKPKELSEFKTPRKLIGYGMSCNYYSVKPLTKAPQSWCYVEE